MEEGACAMDRTMNIKQIERFLDEVSFAMDDVVLFLDTHPYCKEALECYQEYKKLRKEALKQLEKSNHPMQVEQVENSDEWVWAMQPLPWKGGC